MYRYSKNIFVIGTILLLSAGAAYANDIGGNPIKEVGPSVGTLLAAAMETAGYKGQQMVFEQLAGMWGGIAKLVYIVSIIVAIAVTAYGGQFEKTLWFLIAPAIFSLLVNSKVTSAGAEWQFGTFKGQPGEVQQALNDPNSVNAKVSWVFDEFNQFVSTFYQNLIKLITNEDMRQQMRFMARQRILDEMMSAEFSDPGLTAFTRHVFSVCDKEMTASRQMALGNRDPVYKKGSEYAMARAYYTENMSKSTKVAPTGEARSYLDNLLNTKMSGAGGTAPEASVYQNCISETQQQMAGGSSDKLLSGGLSCKQMWCWMAVGIESDVKQIQTQAVQNNVPKEGQNDTELVKGIWQDITNKLTTPTSRSEFEQLEKNSVRPDPSLIPVIVGGHLLRKQMALDPRTAGFNQISEHAGVQVAMDRFNPRANAQQREEVGRQYMEHQSAEAKRYEVFTFAMMLPYIQGAFLYALALLFPFFAIMVLVPGKANALFQWACFWAWAKSWDVGYAIVMVIDDILWSLMPHSSYYDPFKDPNDGPISVMEAAFSGDPSYSLSLYYVIIGMLLLAVPNISAEILLGTRKAVGGIFTNGLKALAANYGATAKNSAAITSITKLDRAREEGASRYALNRINKPANKRMSRLKAELDAWTSIGNTLKGVGTATTLLGAGMALGPAGARGAAAGWETFMGTAGRDVGLARRLGAAAGAGSTAFSNSMTSARALGWAGVAVGGQAVTSAGFRVNRRANAGRASWARLNENYHIVEGSRTDAWDTYNAIDTSLSGRHFFRANNDAGNTIDVQTALYEQELFTDFLGDLGFSVGRGAGDVARTAARIK